VGQSTRVLRKAHSPAKGTVPIGHNARKNHEGNATSVDPTIVCAEFETCRGTNGFVGVRWKQSVARGGTTSARLCGCPVPLRRLATEADRMGLMDDHVTFLKGQYELASRPNIRSRIL